MFPKTTILTIDSHGFYLLDDTHNCCKTIDVTNNTTNTSVKHVYKINATIAGVSNVSTKETRDKTMKKVKKFIQKSNITNKSIQLDMFVSELRDLLVECNQEHVSTLKKDIKYLKEEKAFSNYLHHYNKSYTIEHNLLLEKNYVRFQPDEIYKDTLSELVSGMDLYNIMDSFDIQTFCLSELIQFLNAFQVENIIILDFSCSDFKDGTENVVSERQTRHIRRNLLRKF